MMKYRKKPVVIEAHRLGDNFDGNEIWQGVVDNKIILFMDKNPPHAIIKTLEGEIRADLGDYIIHGVKGEFYPCKPDIFKATYEKVDEQNKGDVR